jgi:hypothetical protein
MRHVQHKIELLRVALPFTLWSSLSAPAPLALAESAGRGGGAYARWRGMVVVLCWFSWTLRALDNGSVRHTQTFGWIGFGKAPLSRQSRKYSASAGRPHCADATPLGMLFLLKCFVLCLPRAGKEGCSAPGKVEENQGMGTVVEGTGEVVGVAGRVGRGVPGESGGAKGRSGRLGVSGWLP